MKLFALSCGHLTGRMRDMMEGGEGDVLLPISTYLIEHPKGRVMFDSGMHTACQSDPAGRLGATARLFGFHYTAGEEVGARLQSIDRDPARVDWLVNSHLHFDHCGGNAQLPNATVVVQRAELEAAKDPELAARTGLGREDWDTGQPLRVVDGEFDLFGDGRVTCIPTPGHTPGHQSLRLRLDSGEVVLAGDACYFCRTLTERRLPRFVHDRAQMLQSLDRLAELQRGGARIFYGHDIEFWRALPQAPDAVE